MATQTQSKQQFDPTIVHIVVVFILMFGFGFIPPIGAITPVGMRVVGVFLGIMYGWSFCGVLWPSLLGLLALGMTGLMPAKELLTLAFSNDMIPFLICMLILVQMLTDCGAITAIANWILTRKSLHGRPWLFSLAYLIALGLLSSFGQAFAAFFLGWGILYSIFKKVGYKPFDLYPAIMIVGTVFSTTCVSIMIPFKAMPLIILGVFQKLSNLTVNYGSYMAFTIPVGFAMMVGYVLVCKYILRPDVTPLKDFDMNSILEKNEPLNQIQKWSLVAFAVAILLLLIPGTFPTSWPIVQLIQYFGNTGSLIVCMIPCMLIKIKGDPILNFAKAAKNGVDWGIVILVAMVLTIAGQFTNDATGIKPFLLQILSPVLSNCSPWLFTIIIFLIAVILTNVMNNMVVGVMLMPVVVTFCDVLGLNPIVSVILVIVGINIAYLTPAASPAAAILFSNKEWMRGKDVFKCGVTIVLTCVLIIIVFAVPYSTLIF